MHIRNYNALAIYHKLICYAHFFISFDEEIHALNVFIRELQKPCSRVETLDHLFKRNS